MEKAEVFSTVLAEFETEEIKNFTIDLLNKMRDEIMTIPSSTSYKYHNKTQCQAGGQLYHMMMVGTIMNYLLGLEYLKCKYPKPKQRDCLRAAALLHDSVKIGWDESMFTVFEHPILAEEFVKHASVEHEIDQKLRDYIGRLTASHSGEWTTSKKSTLILPKPESDDQFLIHLCDYLGSRNNLDMIYSDEQKNAIASFQPKIHWSKVVLTFGVHKGKALVDVPYDYMDFLLNKATIKLNDQLKNALKEAMEDRS